MECTFCIVGLSYSTFGDLVKRPPLPPPWCTLYTNETHFALSPYHQLFPVFSPCFCPPLMHLAAGALLVLQKCSPDQVTTRPVTQEVW